ncbi:hypothetical protein FOA52_005295 [Chlamydomonas sp. UWO 241]|nr:hypothetical protein FOA52_005295 [Chlamydomonas sp. UWO 241]
MRRRAVAAAGEPGVKGKKKRKRAAALPQQQQQAGQPAADAVGVQQPAKKNKKKKARVGAPAAPQQAGQTSAPDAAAKAPKEQKQPTDKKMRVTTGPLHVLTGEAATGAGATAAAAQGRKAALSPNELFDLATPPPPCIGAVCLRSAPRCPASAAWLEVQRSRALDRLRKKHADLCTAAGLEAPPQLSFTRWLFACVGASDGRGGGTEDKKAAGKARKRPFAGPTDAKSDPLLPTRHDGGGLASDHVRAGVAQAGADALAAQLLAASTKEAAEVAKLAQRLSSASTPPSTLLLEVSFHRHSLTMEAGGCFVTLGRGAYDKLCVLHRIHGPEEERLAELTDGQEEAEAAEEEAAACAPGTLPPRTTVHWRLFCILLRYKSLHGAGFQAACGPPVLSLLSTRLGCAFECFASPLNARWASYCSAFPDTDAPFGSRGSFFSAPAFAPAGALAAARGGAFQVNPPFTPSALNAAAHRVLSLLDAAAAAGTALTFAYVLPGWAELEGRAALRASAHNRLCVCVAAADHGFLDGVQHGAGRADPFRISPYDTEVYVLQTHAAAAAKPVGGLGDELRAAFAQCVPSAAALKRQGRAPAPERASGR